ncbi:MAG TPA: DUF979 family protein [Kofleriaceae bacterium]|jgi:uncharacterized membrane protein|nr:DUF979 family protein [Kofleriaceae bacterium]
MLTLPYVFKLIGVLIVGAALLNARERRWSTAAFWAIVAVACVAGDWILAADKAGTRWPAQAMGGGVVALALLASRSRTRVMDDGDPATRAASAARLGNRLFIPALAIPALVAVFVLAAKLPGSGVTRVIDPAQLPLISLGLAAVIALAVALGVTHAAPVRGLTEGRRLLDTIGWPVVLPTMLATLGSVFVETGVGKAIAALVSAAIPTQSWFACLLAFGLGMIAFTAIMGNAFAAFPVMMAGIGLPLLVTRHGANPAALGALGMLTGYCGTLLTPMAANFNIVPAVLLELRDEYGVIRVQWPTSLALIIANLLLMSLLVFR